VEGGNRSDIETRLNELTSASHKLAEVLYKQAGARSEAAGAPGPEQPQGSTEQGGASSGEGEGVIDAEYEDVNKK